MEVGTTNGRTAPQGCLLACLFVLRAQPASRSPCRANLAAFGRIAALAIELGGFMQTESSDPPNQILPLSTLATPDTHRCPFCRSKYLHVCMYLLQPLSTFMLGAPQICPNMSKCEVGSYVVGTYLVLQSGQSIPEGKGTKGKITTKQRKNKKCQSRWRPRQAARYFRSARFPKATAMQEKPLRETKKKSR